MGGHTWKEKVKPTTPALFAQPNIKYNTKMPKGQIKSAVFVDFCKGR
jgi:hypothetical protein